MEDKIYTGSSDSTIQVWQDSTLQVLELEQKQIEETDKKMEDLGIFIKRNDYRNAIILAIELDQPMKLLSIFSKLQKFKNGSIFGHAKVDEFMKNISKEQVN